MSNLTHTVNSDSGFVFDYEFSILKKFIYHIWMCILLFGLVANIINIVVFMKIGQKDNVTVTLLFLSISDLLFLVINSPTIVGRYLYENQSPLFWSFNPYIIMLGSYWYAYVFYDYSSFISVFLATVRCACVARPLQFKSMFTKSRTVRILCLLFLLALILRVPVLTVFRLSWELNPLTNSTYRSLEFSDNSQEIYKANDILNRNIISWLSYITITTCVVILVSKLRSASRFRQSLASQQTTSKKSSEEEKTFDQAPDPLDCPESNSIKPFHHGMKDSDKMSGRDLQIIKSVTLICVIFIFSQLPFQVVSTVRLFVPEFGNFKSAQQIYGFTSHISRTCGFLNASINIFVHFRFNSRYRSQFLALLCKNPVESTIGKTKP